MILVAHCSMLRKGTRDKPCGTIRGAPRIIEFVVEDDRLFRPEENRSSIPTLFEQCAKQKPSARGNGTESPDRPPHGRKTAEDGEAFMFEYDGNRQLTK